jgi:hypothetical protein
VREMEGVSERGEGKGRGGREKECGSGGRWGRDKGTEEGRVLGDR